VCMVCPDWAHATLPCKPQTSCCIAFAYYNRYLSLSVLRFLGRGMCVLAQTPSQTPLSMLRGAWRTL
jgi:hypothetical protein